MIELWRDESNVVGEHAAISLWELGDGTTVEVLLEILGAPDERVRKLSSFSSRELFETVAKRMIEPLHVLGESELVD